MPASPPAPLFPTDHAETDEAAARLLAAVMRGEAPPPPGTRRLVKLDLPPEADLTTAELCLVGEPQSGRIVAAPVEIVGEGLRLWHDRARSLGIGPGGLVWVLPLPRSSGGAHGPHATGAADPGSTVCTRMAHP